MKSLFSTLAFLGVAAAIIAPFSDVEVLEAEGRPLCHGTPEEQSGTAPRNGVRDTRKRWPQRTVVYQLASSISAQDRRVIQSGLDDITINTCVRFKVRGNERNFVAVGNQQSGCYSYVGMIGGSQELNLGRGCMTKATVVHEFMHAIGFEHEHQSPSRDDHVRIHLENVDQKWHFAFEKYNSSYVTDFGVPYDLQSVMQYHNRAFSNNRKDTIVPIKDPSIRLGNNQGLTNADSSRINRMYGCE